jgi:transcriptional regulator with XRE-family HTH domain
LDHLARTGWTIGVVRRSRGLSQTELSKNAGMGVSTLIAIEKGSHKVAIGHWMKTMEALGLQAGIRGFGQLGDNEALIQEMAKFVPKRSTVRTVKR